MKMKKILAGITAVVLTASVSGISVFAENTPTGVIESEITKGATYNNLAYTIRTNSYGEKYVEIYDCSTTAVSVIIPDTI